jgi:hypothetical protein
VAATDRAQEALDHEEVLLEGLSRGHGPQPCGF